MIHATYYELRQINPDGSYTLLTEGLGEVENSSMSYVSARGARGGLRRMKRDDEIPKGGRVAVFKITVEELPDPDGHSTKGETDEHDPN